MIRTWQLQALLQALRQSPEGFLPRGLFPERIGLGTVNRLVELGYAEAVPREVSPTGKAWRIIWAGEHYLRRSRMAGARSGR